MSEYSDGRANLLGKSQLSGKTDWGNIKIENNIGQTQGSKTNWEILRYENSWKLLRSRHFLEDLEVAKTSCGFLR